MSEKRERNKATLMVKTTQIARMPIGYTVHTQRAYQSMSRGQVAIETIIASGTISSGLSSK